MRAQERRGATSRHGTAASLIGTLAIASATVVVSGCAPRGPSAGEGVATTPSEPAEPAAAEPAGEERAFRKMTPLLTVDAIEPCLPLWVDRLGFAKTMEVPPGGPLAFVALERDGLEVMLQTRASVEEDVPEAAPHFRGASVLYVEVADLDWLVERLGDAEVLVPPRTTDYGMREVFVREPCGHVLGFAAPAGD